MSKSFFFQSKGRQLKDTGLAFEDVVTDHNAVRDPGSISAKRVRQQLLLPLLAFAVLVVVLLRLANLQLVLGSELRQQAEGNRLRAQILLAPRGLILDRNGKELARNIPGFALLAMPQSLPERGLDEIIAKLEQLMGVAPGTFQKALTSVSRQRFEPVTLLPSLTETQRIQFETKRTEFPGFLVFDSPQREYLYPEVFSHTLGYTGALSPEEYEKYSTLGYSLQDNIGKTGIEKQYEAYLHGVNGASKAEEDVTGRVLRQLGQEPPLSGNDLTLTLDYGLQEKLYELFAERGKIKGAAVALSPKTGEVLALMSFPGYDNNLFSGGISEADFRRLTSDPGLPLFNRAISGTYPPGSTVKPMVGLAGLEEGLITENTVVVDRGVLYIPNQFDPNVTYSFVGWKRTGLGPVTVRSAVARSSDIFFYVLAGGHNTSAVSPLGIERLSAYYRKFNLGRVTGLDLPGEASGVVADPEWKKSYFAGDAILSKWYLGDTYHTGIGQGDMLVTPLQVTLWTSTIANGGVGMRPHLLKRVTSTAGEVLFEAQNRELIAKQFADKNVRIIQDAMNDTVQYGSAQPLKSLRMTSAGKTGTSQFDGSDPNRTHAWFTSYAPFENPEIALTILVEAGGEGHAAALPIAKEALLWWQENRWQKN